MAREIVAYKMSLRHGNCIKIVGDIPRDAKHIKKIICNSRNDGMWGKELQEHNFPFVLGTTMEISIIFEAHGFKVKLPDGFEFTFPNRLKLHTLNYLEIGHDILIRSVTFK
ncbi:galectin-1-like isoform X6 [Antechinus flavipes]|uniref:galectin-1-like isoform X6 n=1 Tax=Antechinus flavipes TaxID=38775 RepID=UPI00223597B9|nr:galectin-1-like isoform X6 [Antechinus flavipes]